MQLQLILLLFQKNVVCTLNTILYDLFFQIIVYTYKKSTDVIHVWYFKFSSSALNLCCLRFSMFTFFSFLIENLSKTIFRILCSAFLYLKKNSQIHI